MKTISISKGNSKMGAIPSVSLPPIVTCKNCATCAKNVRTVQRVQRNVTQ